MDITFKESQRCMMIWYLPFHADKFIYCIKPDLDTIVPDIHKLRPRNTGDIVGELSALAENQADDVFTKMPYEIHPSASDKNLCTARVSAMLRMPHEDPSKYCTLNYTGGTSVLVPKHLYDILYFILQWMSTMASVYKDEVPGEIQNLMCRDYCILWYTLHSLLSHACKMWAYGLMTHKWSPFVLGVTVTYWDLIGILDPVAWTDNIGDGMSTWMKISCKPRMFYLWLLIVFPGWNSVDF